jgi:hypothetical protein
MTLPTEGATGDQQASLPLRRLIKCNEMPGILTISSIKPLFTKVIFYNWTSRKINFS